MPLNNLFIIILLSNINDNNQYDYFYYNDMDNNGKVIIKTDSLENIFKTYKIYIILYKLLKD